MIVPYISVMSFLVLWAFSMHPLYISITEIYYIEERGEVEVIIRAFTSDLEKVINEANGSYIFLQNEDSLQKYQSDLLDYVNERVDLSINNKKLKLNFQQAKLEAQAAKMVFTIPYKNARRMKQLKMRNTLLLELNERQINLIRCYIRDEVLFVKLTKDHQEDTIDLPEP